MSLLEEALKLCKQTEYSILEFDSNSVELVMLEELCSSWAPGQNEVEEVEKIDSYYLARRTDIASSLLITYPKELSSRLICIFSLEKYLT